MTELSDNEVGDLIFEVEKLLHRRAKTIRGTSALASAKSCLSTIRGSLCESSVKAEEQRDG